MYLENSIEPDNKTERSKAQQMVRRDPHREEDLGERFSQFASAHGTAVGNDYLFTFFLLNSFFYFFN